MRAPAEPQIGGGQAPVSVTLAGRFPHLGRRGRERSSTRSVAGTVLGLASLAAAVFGSVWIAVGAADGRYLLELPTSANPHWIDGPLRGLAKTVGSLGPSALSAALVILVASYVVALACAGSIPLPFVLASIVLANVAFTLGPTLVSTDVFGYIAYAREAAAHGLNPYVSPPISIPHDGILQFVYWKHQTSPYGPLFTFLSVPLGLVSASAALWSYKAAAGLASIATAFIIADLARRRGLNPARAAIFVGLNPVLLFYAVSGGHNDVLAVVLVVCAVALVLRGRESAAAATAVAAAAIKVTLGLALPFVLIGARRRKTASRGATLALFVIAVPTLLVFGTHFFGQLHRIAGDHQFDTAFSGPDRLATALRTQIDIYVRAVCTGGAAVVALLIIARTWRGGDQLAAAGWAFLALIASIASFAPWYLVWLLPLAALGRSRALGLAALLATLYTIAVHLPALGGVPWLSSASRIDQLHGPRPGVGDEHPSAARVDRDRVWLTPGRVPVEQA